MSTQVRSLLVVAIATTAIAAANTASAVSPGHQGGHHHHTSSLPKFGFVSHNTGWGEQVTRVFCNSRAQRFGLERHDVIMAINGRPLTYKGSWYDALRDATYQGEYMTLQIRDHRTGQIVQRTVSIWGGPSQTPKAVHYQQSPKQVQYSVRSRP